MLAKDKLQFLIFEVANWYNHAAGRGQLGEEGSRGGRCASGDDDGVKRGEFEEAQGTVAAVNVNIGIAEASEAFGSRSSQVGAIFDGNIHSLGGDFYYDAALNRAVSVSTAAITEALNKVYGQPALIAELNR